MAQLHSVSPDSNSVPATVKSEISTGLQQSVFNCVPLQIIPTGEGQMRG